MTIAPLIPENAPFTSEQRAWLNGFFAGLLSTGESAGPIDAGTAMGAGQEADPLADGDDGETPWHDQSLALEERMTLAEGRPLRRRMMAAMAQQDCGQCGYNCEDYSNAIFLKEEERLNLCVPGGKATQRMLKKLVADEMEGSAETEPAAPPAEAAPATAPGRAREAPVMATLAGRYRLNGEDSAKETYHVEFDLSASGLDYEVGDAFGIVPTNPPTLIEALIARLGVEGDMQVRLSSQEKSLAQALSRDVCLGLAPDALFALLASLAQDSDDKARLLAMSEGEDPDGDLETLDVLAALDKLAGIAPAPQALVEVLDPLQPRLYSISSSHRAGPGMVSLTVDSVRYDIAGRTRLGVASTGLAERLAVGSEVPVYVQKAHDFALPADGATPIVMVGPGTGIAPFRAFLQERMAAGATGRAWLFFGHQTESSDFFYRDELEGFQAAGTLTRLSTAWSRDSGPKTYVQDRMREAAAELFAWLEEGAHFYVCGDATRMAADVDRALAEIVAAEGGMDENAARDYVRGLAKSGRYQRDVY